MDCNILDLEYNRDELDQKFKTVYEQLLIKSENIDEGNFTKIGTKDLRVLFSLYDREFLGGFFKEWDYDIHFRFSKRLTKSGGNTKYNKDDGSFTISMSVPILHQTFNDVNREVKVNGIVCTNRTEAAMRVFEHEIIHVIEWTHFDTSNHNRPLFKQLAKNIFGHTDIYHQMVTQEERAAKVYGLTKGKKVFFEYSGEEHQGVITRITKRATVMVRDREGGFQDEDGKRYSKYYIPLPHLTPVEEE